MSRLVVVRELAKIGVRRVVFGPQPRLGPGRRRVRWRCRVGLHRRVEVWSFTTISETDRANEGGGRTVARRMATRLDRPPDHIRCEWCWRVW